MRLVIIDWGFNHVQRWHAVHLFYFCFSWNTSNAFFCFTNWFIKCAVTIVCLLRRLKFKTIIILRRIGFCVINANTIQSILLTSTFFIYRKVAINVLVDAFFFCGVKSPATPEIYLFSNDITRSCFIPFVLWLDMPQKIHSNMLFESKIDIDSTWHL